MSGSGSEDKVRNGARTLVSAFLIILLVYATVRLVIAARVEPLWYDEILTRLIAGQNSLAGTMRAVIDRTDSHTVLFYLIEHYSLRLFRNEEFALRLPSVVAFGVTLICVFVYARRRWTAGEALACAACLLATAAFQKYAAEARAYGLLLACFAVAMVCYDRVPSKGWTIGLAVSLLSAGAIHYYAIFSVLPFAFAEATHAWMKRVVRWGVWAAIACAVVPLAATWRFLATLRGTYGAHFWAHSGLNALPTMYGDLLLAGPIVGSVNAVILLAVLGRDVFLCWKLKRPESDTLDGVLRASLLLLPMIAFSAAVMLHGPVLARYVIPTILGMVLATGSFRVAPKGINVIVFAFLAFHAVISETIFWSTVQSKFATTPMAKIESLIQEAGHKELPVVVAQGLIFLPLERYSSTQLRPRLIYVVDVNKAIECLGTDSIDENLTRLRRYSPISAVDFQDFTRSHSEFLLYTRELEPNFDWLSPYLAKTARSVEVLREDANGKVFHVRM